MNYQPPTPSPDQIRGVTVEEIVSGTRCSPLTLKEFEGFLLHEEHSVENLQFIVWYRSYCERFNALAPEYKALSSPPTERFTSFYTPAGSIRTASSIKEKDDAWWQKLVRRRSTSSNHSATREPEDVESQVGPGFGSLTEAEKQDEKEMEKREDTVNFKSAINRNSGGSGNFGEDVDVFPTRSRPPSLVTETPPEAEDQTAAVPRPTPSSAVFQRVQSTFSDSSSINTDTTERRAKRLPNLRFANLIPIISRGSLRELPEDTPLPFVDEITLILTTFILPGSSKELNIDARLRKHILKSLQPIGPDGEKGPPVTTHPAVFAEAADHAYSLMERSLPHYLQWAKGNTNTPKMLFWIAVGCTDFMIGVMIALLILFFVHHRGWRIFSFIFIQFGAMQAYSATRYFCSQVHGRTSRQLYPWELSSELDSSSVSNKVLDTTSPQDKVKADLAASMPFLFEGDAASQTVVASSIEKKSGAAKPSVSQKAARFRGKFFASLSSEKGVKVPVFGPERVIEDPYIKDLHNKQIREILIVGAVVMVLFEAAILAIPEQVPR